MVSERRNSKPLGIKAYGSIPHLPESRLGPGDHHCHVGQAVIMTERKRDSRDTIIVQEKLDGSCVSVAKINGEIVPLGRAGYPAISSRFEQHRLFHFWVMEQWSVFDRVLDEGERIVGEWLAQAHGTRYDLDGRSPFVFFDIMRGQERLTVQEATDRAADAFEMAMTFHAGDAMPVEKAMQWVKYEIAFAGEHGWHGALDPVEGVIYRVERDGKVDFIAKYVRTDKVDGAYFDGDAVWNWRPARLTLVES